MTEESEEQLEAGSWADQLWGPRAPDWVDLRPEPLPDDPPTPDGDLAADVDVDAPTGSPSPGAGVPTEVAASLAHMEKGLRLTLAESRAAASEELQAGLEALARVLDERLRAGFASGASPLADQVETALRDEPQRLAARLAEVETTFLNAVGRLDQELAERLEASPAAVRTDRAERHDAPDGLMRDVGERVRSEIEAMRDALRAEVANSVSAIVAEQTSRSEAWRAQVDSTIAARLDHLASRFEDMRVELCQAVTDGAQAQASWTEHALNALAKAVADERRSSAALVRGALAATDQTLHEVCQTLAYLVEAVGAVPADAVIPSTRPASTG